MYFLMSSLSRKFNQRGYRKYGHAQHRSHNSELEYVEIEHVQRKDFINDQVKMLTIFQYGQPMGKNTGE